MIFVLILIGVGTFYSVFGAFYALLFYLWNAYFRPDEWTYGGYVQMMNLSYIIGTYLVIRTFFSMPDPKLNSRTGLIILFAMQCVISTATSEHPAWSQAFLVDFAKVLLISYLMVVLLDDRRKFRMALLVIALSLSFECAKQGWVNLYRAPGARNDNRVAFLGDNNGVALGTMMMIPILAALAQTAVSRWEKRLHQFLAVGVFLRGISTYSRGGFLSAGVLGVMTFVRSRRKLRTLVIVAAASVLVYLVMPSRYWERIDTITVESEEERDASAAGRLHFWNVALVMAAEKPATGVGLNAFSSSYPAYNTDERFRGERAAHSTWFGVLGDLGYPGLLLLVGNLAVAVYSCWRVFRLTRDDPEKRELGIYANALLTSLIVFSVGGTFLSNQYNEMFWHFVGLSAALHASTVRELAAARAVVPATRMGVQQQPVPALR
jgi:probable O-glycosylation ligase (exosortase A-associated)